MFEKPDFDIAKGYSDIMKTMWFTAFYAPVIPMGLIFSIISLICLYWIHKYNVLRRSIIRYNMSAELSIEMTELLEWVLILYAGSNFLFEYIFNDGKVSVWGVIGLAVAVINAFLPMQWINE